MLYVERLLTWPLATFLKISQKRYVAQLAIRGRVRSGFSSCSRLMSASNTKSLLASFTSRIRTLNSTRQKVDSLAKAGQLSRRAAEQMYESLFLNCFTAFEVLIEDVFLAHLVSRTASKAVPRLTIKSLPIARELVVGPGKKYADWLPFDRTIERANLFFRGGRPFADAPEAHRALVDKAQFIRNLIAHRSRHSQEQFETKVIAGAPLPPREKAPAAYLRGLTSGTPPLTRSRIQRPSATRAFVKRGDLQH